MSFRDRIKIVALLTASLVVLSLPSAASGHSVRIVRAAGGHAGVAVFKLRHLPAGRVRAGWLAPRGLRRLSGNRGSSTPRLRFARASQRRVGTPRLRLAARRGVLRLRVGSPGGSRGEEDRADGRGSGRDGEPALVVELEDSGEGTGGEAPTPPATPSQPSEPTPTPTPTSTSSPAPAPAPSSGGECSTAAVSLSADSPFGAGAWPSGCWRPYADSSPFNQPIPPSPRLVSNSAAIVSTLNGWGKPSELRAGIADSSSDWDHPIYYATAADPVFTVHCTASWGTCEVEGEKIHIPQAARAAGGGDAHLAVVDQTTGWEYDLYKYCYEGCASSSIRTLPSGGGPINVRWGGKTPVQGDGLGSDATAALFGLAAGVIRPEELLRGRIDHALFMVVRCDSGKAVWPAAGLGAKCSGDASNAPSEGTRFQLDMSASEIEALAVPDWKKTVLRAMAEYGMYVGDTSGGNPWNLEFASGSTYTSFGVEDQMVQAAKQLGIRASSDGRYYFDLASGVDWQSRLRVIDPCVARGTC